MSVAEHPDDGGERIRAYGCASENGLVIQSGANQYVTYIQLTVEHEQAVLEARDRADHVVHTLTRAVGQLAMRCDDLEEKARRAKAEGRAEAHAEFAEKLKDAELHVLHTQQMMRAAQEARAETEKLLDEAYRELARLRGEAVGDAGTVAGAADAAGDSPETRRFAHSMEQAEAKLGTVRDNLRQLSEEAHSRGSEPPPGVVPGPRVVKPDPAEKVRPYRPSTPTKLAGSLVVSPPVAWLMAVVIVLAAALPFPVAGSAVRAVYSADAPPPAGYGTGFILGMVLFAGLITVFLCAAFVALLDLSTVVLVLSWGFYLFLGLGLFVVAIGLDPKALPALTAVGHFLGEYLGPL
ncbi:hypothetical protein [Streptomyces sp. NPDC001480]|uniref:hypothetical protein n=1 Tax=Streptomyces sp. NPDC001480 TaxID=3364577 RepID=UPI0036737F9A